MGVVEGLKLRGQTYWSDFYWGGQRIRKTLHTRDLATALERLRYIRAGLAGADVVIADDVPATVAQRTAGELLVPEASDALGDSQEDASGFLELANAYLADLRLRTDKRNSIRCAEYQVGQLLRVVPALRRRRIRRDDLRAFIHQRLKEGVSAATINQALSIVKSIIRFGVREKTIRNPEIDFASLALKKTRRERYLTSQQIEKLLEAAKYIDARVYPLVYLAYHSGARLGELLQLRWGWIDEETGRVQIRTTKEWSSKTREGRVFYLPPDTLAWLRDYRARLKCASDQDFVLQMDAGRPWTEQIHKVLRKVFKAAGIDSRIGVHGLRHSSVTDMLESGVPVHVVQQHHGHKDSTTTLRHYAHARDAAMREAAELMASKRSQRSAIRSSSR